MNYYVYYLVGSTTSSEILSWFGAPTDTAILGNEQIFIYKYCKNEGKSYILPGLADAKIKENCNELTVVFDKSSNIITNFNYNKQISEKSKK